MFRRLAALLMSLTLAVPVTASAQTWAHGGGGHEGGRREGGGYGAGRGGYGDVRGGYGGGYDGGQGGYHGGPGAQPGGRYANPGVGPFGNSRGPGPMAGRGGMPGYGAPGRQGWARGQFLPPEARGEMIGDFGRFHLRRPPRGYYWDRAGDAYVRASVSTGLIFEAIPAEPF